MQASTKALRFFLMFILLLLVKSQDEVRANWIALNYWLRPNALTDYVELYNEHIVHVQEVLVANEQLVTAGILGENEDGLFAFIKNATREEVDDFIYKDPLYKNGLLIYWWQKPFGAVYIDGLPQQN